MDRPNFVLDQKHQDFYHENGYMILEDVFRPRECDQMVAIYERYAKPDFRGIMNLDRGFIEYYEMEQEEEVCKLVAVHPEDAMFIRKVAMHPKIVISLDSLQGEEMMLLQSMFLFKRVGTPYANQAWNDHQDNAYPLADYGDYITGNISCSDQSPENGGLYIYPGSHREPVLPNIKVKSYQEDPGARPGHRVEEVPEEYRDKKTDLLMRKGSILFLHGNVIHGSYSNQSRTHSRPMLSFPYGRKGIACGKTFLVGMRGKRMEMPMVRYLKWE